MSGPRGMVLMLVVGAWAPMAAQVDNNAHAWFNYFGDHPIAAKSRWGVHLEGQWRRADVGFKWQQLLLRPGVNFQVHRRVMLTGGYAFVDTFRYGSFPARARFPEHRTYQQAQISQRAFRLDWQHRLRLEQRHIGGLAARYENRFRYMLRVNLPVRRGYYVGLYDEYFHNFGREVGANKFDQNRAYVAVGHPVARDTRLEVGFMEQTLQQRSGRYEHNHTLMVSVFSRLPWGK